MESKKIKILRKNYLSYVNKVIRDDSIELSSHGNMKTPPSHYIDIEMITKDLNMKIID